jgi:hypothetical protein
MDTTHHKNQVSVKMTTWSLRSRKALEETEEATEFNVESENSVMSGGEQQGDLGQNREKGLVQ